MIDYYEIIQVQSISFAPYFMSSNLLLLQDLATPEAFSRYPSRVWEFYHYRRELALSKKPTTAHYAIAECEARLRKQGRDVVVITQCIDDLHLQAGSKHVLKIHGEKISSIHVTYLYSTVARQEGLRRRGGIQ